LKLVEVIEEPSPARICVVVDMSRSARKINSAVSAGEVEAAFSVGEQDFKHSAEFKGQIFMSHDSSMTVFSALDGNTKLLNEKSTALWSDQ